MDIFERIMPQPKQAALKTGAGLELTERSAFALRAKGSFVCEGNTAVRQLEDFFKAHCGADCFRKDKSAVPVTLALGKAPEGVRNADEGYALSVSAGGVTVTGFGERGLRIGAVTLMQMCAWEEGRCALPALDILDWPEQKVRGLFIESRYGSNVMEREDWFRMVDEVAAKKLNVLEISLYGCWSVQFDGRVSECLFVPVGGHPELETPAVVRYYSPTEDRWVDCEKLPPIFREDFFGELCRYGRERGITVFPLWNSLGHNTLLPDRIPAVSAKEEDGTPSHTGFCTSNEATYDLLFSIYDGLIDKYLKPNGIDWFCLAMDEVADGIGYNAKDIFRRRATWCRCPKCRDLDKGELYIRHAIRLIRHLKDKGMKTVIIAHDMLDSKQLNPDGTLGEKLLRAAEAADVKDVLTIDWWAYYDNPDDMPFRTTHPELGLRAQVKPWNGYYIWSLLFSPLSNVRIMSELGRREGAEGVITYAMWDMSYDRVHDATAEYSWDLDAAGSEDDVTARYARRLFPTRAADAERALHLTDCCGEYRKARYDDPFSEAASPRGLLLNVLGYYHDYSYVKADNPYPRRFPGDMLEKLLAHRGAFTREIYRISAMAREAKALFDSIAGTPGCDAAMARRLSYENENFCCLAEDGLALLKMYDLTQCGKYRAVAPLARERERARLALMRSCEEKKEKFFREGLAMRLHSIYLLLFRDLADYAETADDPKIDLMNLDGVMSERFWSLR